MDYVVYYEIISFIILGIIYLFYLCRNWLDLRRNRRYYVLLLTVMLATGVDMAGRILFQQIGRNNLSFMMLIATVANLGLLITCTELYAYFCSLSRCQKKIFLVLERIYYVMTIVLGLEMLLNSRMHLLFWYSKSHEYYFSNALYGIIVMEALYLFTGICVLWQERHFFKLRYQWVILVISALMILGIIPLQNLMPTRFRMTYYVLSCILSVYYFMIHMADQHLRQRGGCFSRVGMRQVVEEREVYQKDFVCVSVNITNIFSIINVCTEEEMRLFDLLIGKHLKSISKQCVIYQSHSSEYILMCKEQKIAEANCLALREAMPAVLRIHDRNISVSYGYYMVSFADASFREGSFYRIIAGLRRVVKNTTDHRTVVQYEGEVKEKLQRELQGIQKINEILETDRGNFEMEFIPIYSTRYGKVEEIEVESFLCLKDGYRVREAELWKLAEEKGSARDMALQWWKEVLDCVVEQRILERGITLLHINVTPLQISSQKMIDQLCLLLEERQIRPDQIVVEVFVDQSVTEEILQQKLKYMRQKGFRMLLDQFGINICNLKNILSMPFDQVKINVQLTNRLIKKKQDELQYIIHMLRKQNWEIYLDGVDRLTRSSALSEMGVDRIQGEHLGPNLSVDQLQHWLEQKGGDAS